jgi:uncharacterized phage protein (TIGR02220 family)
VNYYRRYLGDYMRDTMHLSILEHGAYTLLLDAYYASEKPLPADYDALYRVCRAMSRQEQDAVKAVADQFFPIEEDGLRHNPRADREVGVAQATIEKQRKSGVESAAKRWSTDRSTHKGINGSTNELTDGLAIQPPTTNHHPPSSNPHKSNVGQKPDVSRKQEALEILIFLNDKAGRAYKPVPANLDLITARLREGASADECKAVVEKKCRDWAGDDKMADYLRPKTIFNRTNFAQYQGELGSDHRRTDL